jgi:hypothetical protein
VIYPYAAATALTEGNLIDKDSEGIYNSTLSTTKILIVNKIKNLPLLNDLSLIHQSTEKVPLHGWN